MLASFWVAFNAVVPFVLYMLFGAFARKTGVADEKLLNRLNTLVFRAFFPFLMFKNLYYMDTEFTIAVPYVCFAVGSVLLLICVLMVFVPRFVKEKKRQGVIVQALYRSNLVLFGIPLAENIYGKESNLLATMIVAFIVPLYNISAVIVLEYFRGNSANIPALCKKILTNPLIMGVIAGALCKTLHVPVPAQLGEPIKTFADMATPLALFALGGTLTVSALGHNARALSVITALKMLVIPSVVFSLTLLFPFSHIERFMLLLVHATPVAVSSYPMAQNMGGDGELAGQIVVFTTLVSILTLFLFIFVLRTLGLI